MSNVVDLHPEKTAPAELGATYTPRQALMLALGRGASIAIDQSEADLVIAWLIRYGHRVVPK